jgi:hypothetical protein
MLPSTYLCLGIRWVHTFQQQEQPITFVYFVLLADIKAQHMRLVQGTKQLLFFY